jgi:hypothetical protein
MLEHYKMTRWIEGIDLEQSTLRDQVEKPISHLGGLETEGLVGEARERVSMEEEDPREAPHEPLRPPVTRDEDGEKRTVGHR